MDREVMTEEKELGNKLCRFICIAGILLIAGPILFSAHTQERQKKEETYHILELYSVRMESLLDGLFHKTDTSLSPCQRRPSQHHAGYDRKFQS